MREPSPALMVVCVLLLTTLGFVDLPSSLDSVAAPNGTIASVGGDCLCNAVLDAGEGQAMCEGGYDIDIDYGTSTSGYCEIDPGPVCTLVSHCSLSGKITITPGDNHSIKRASGGPCIGPSGNIEAVIMVNTCGGGPTGTAVTVYNNSNCSGDGECTVYMLGWCGACN